MIEFFVSFLCGSVTTIVLTGALYKHAQKSKAKKVCSVCGFSPDDTSVSARCDQ